jgi:Sulfotransferase family
LGFAFDLAEIGRYYRDYVELMAHFDTVLPGRIHRVIYEDMVANPEQEIRRLLDHCGLPFEESCLRFHETERGILTPSSEQVRQPIFADALNHWRHYEPWLGALKTALGDVLESYPAAPKFGERAFGYGAQWILSGNYRLSATLRGAMDKR